MKTLSLSEAKVKFSALVDAVNASDEEIIVTETDALPLLLSAPMSMKASRRHPGLSRIRG